MSTGIVVNNPTAKLDISGDVKPMSLDEFEQGYASRSNVTVEWLHQHGQCGAPCDCGEEGCQGWQMLTIETDGRVGIGV